MTPERAELERQVRDAMELERLRAENERLQTLVDHFADELVELRRQVATALATIRGESPQPVARREPN